MTYKQKLESQLSFARNKMLEAELLERHGERHTWSGYIQALRYAITEHITELQHNEVTGEAQCQCDHGDLRPFGECICGADKVAPV